MVSRLGRVGWTIALSIMCLVNSIVSAQVVLIGNTGPETNFGPPSSIVDINLQTGEATNPRSTGLFALAGIAAHPTTGIVYGLTTTPTSTLQNTLVQIDITTGAYTVVGPTGLRVVEGDLAFNPVNGMHYGIQDVGLSGIQRNLFQINPTTGVGTVIGNVGPFEDDYSTLAFDNNGTLYAINTSSAVQANSTLVTIDPLTAAITSSTIMNVNLSSAAGLAINPYSGAAYIADGGIPDPTNLLHNLDLTAGIANPIGPLLFSGGVSGLTFMSVPEPSSMSLLGIAALALGAKHLSKHRKSLC